LAQETSDSRRARFDEAAKSPWARDEKGIAYTHSLAERELVLFDDLELEPDDEVI
jgi:hypothetical protein